MTKEREAAAQGLRVLADMLESSDGCPTEARILQESVIPAIGCMLEGDLDYFCVIGFGPDVRVTDWINTKEAALFDIAGRLLDLANLLSATARHKEMNETEDQCCECEDNPNVCREVEEDVN